MADVTCVIFHAEAFERGTNEINPDPLMEEHLQWRDALFKAALLERARRMGLVHIDKPTAIETVTLGWDELTKAAGWDELIEAALLERARRMGLVHIDKPTAIETVAPGDFHFRFTLEGKKYFESLADLTEQGLQAASAVHGAALGHARHAGDLPGRQKSQPFINP
jgi:hypothetical protein